MKTNNSIRFLIINAAFLLLSIIFITSCKKDKIDNGSGNDPIPDEPGVAITNPLCFTAEEGRVAIEIWVREGYETSFDFEYSYDNVKWNTFIPDYTIVVLAEAGEKVYFRGHNPLGLSPNHNVFDEEYFYFIGPCARFVTNDKAVALSGNVMSLIDTVYRANKPLPTSCFAGLFEYTSVTSAPELPATLLSEFCYTHMFFCTNLASAPELPAMVLKKRCYSDMFYGCDNLAEAPELPATILADWCYAYMFGSCSGITTAPELPAMTLAPYCYEGMFNLCGGIATTPELPATTLVEGCYENMFHSCYSLNSVRVHFTEWRDDATNCWLGQNSNYGTFYCPGSLPQEFGYNRIPTHWTVVTF